MSNRNEPTIKSNPFEWMDLCRFNRLLLIRFTVSRPQGVDRQGMLNVGQNQLLVLLLMLHAYLNNSSRLLIRRLNTEVLLKGSVNMSSISDCFFKPRT